MIPNLSNPLYVEAIKKIELVLTAYHYNALFSSSERSFEREEQILNNFLAKKVCGVILLDIEGHEETLKKMAEQGVVVAVMCGESTYDFPCLQFFCDLQTCGKNATEHLLQIGRKRIAYLSGPLRISSREQLLAGHKACLKEYHITEDPALICIAESETDASGENYEHQNGYKLLQQLLECGVSFDAVLAGNDMTAIGAMEALRQAGYKIPGQVAVMGMDNTMISAVAGLSTVEIFCGEFIICLKINLKGDHTL